MSTPSPQNINEYDIGMIINEQNDEYRDEYW